MQLKQKGRQRLQRRNFRTRTVSVLKKLQQWTKKETFTRLLIPTVRFQKKFLRKLPKRRQTGLRCSAPGLLRTKWSTLIQKETLRQIILTVMENRDTRTGHTARMRHISERLLTVISNLCWQALQGQ